MFCCKCHRDLAECICEDLQERLEAISNCPHVFIAPEQMQKYEKQAKKNKDEKVETE